MVSWKFPFLVPPFLLSHAPTLCFAKRSSGVQESMGVHGIQRSNEMLLRIVSAVLVTCLSAGLVADLASSMDQLALGRARDQGWICLFDGETLGGLKCSENQGTFGVQDGLIMARGPSRSGPAAFAGLGPDNESGRAA
jgi:hypothetical protein